MRKWKKLPRHPNIYEYETQKGKRYGIRRGFTNSAGKKDEYTKSGFKTWRDADIILKKFESELALQETDVLSSRSITFDQYFQRMKQHKLATKQWRITTLAQKDNYYKSLIKDKFGNIPLQQITRIQYQNYIDELIKQGYAQTTLETLNQLVQQTMNSADRDNVIRSNDLKGIEINGAVAPRDVKLEKDEYQKFMATAKKILSKFKLTMLYLIALGNRREEAAGLQFRSFVKDADDNGDYYIITYYVGRTQETPNGGPLKNNSSYRSNIIRGEIVEYVDYFLEHSKEIYQKTHREIAPESFVYVNEKNGMPTHPSNINREIFKKVSDECGIKVHPHMLRHYFATIALADGVPDMEVANWLGHKNVSMTHDYSRPTEFGTNKVSTAMMNTLYGTTEKNK
ncbi:tyrosine-type recombinase/integrase [Lapidilactobacillus dextrinicus]|uniref:tyrosine-type recombinase/integrase n=1 Tax=Lapidilactobacillus dextrinicus TaxID=51664 RepID=UPI003F29E188